MNLDGTGARAGHRFPRINLLHGEDDSAIECTIELLARIFTDSYSNAGFALDGSLKSVEELDRIGASLVRPAAGTQSRDERVEVENFIQGAGAYFGKVLRESFGGAWVRDMEGHLHLIGLCCTRGPGLGDLGIKPFKIATGQVREGGNLFSALVAGIQDRLASGS